MPDKRWTFFHLTGYVMQDVREGQQAEIITARDEVLGHLLAALNSISRADSAMGDEQGKGFMDMLKWTDQWLSTAVDLLNRAIDDRWEKINEGGRLEDENLWKPDR